MDVTVTRRFKSKNVYGGTSSISYVGSSTVNTTIVIPPTSEAPTTPPVTPPIDVLPRKFSKSITVEVPTDHEKIVVYINQYACTLNSYFVHIGSAVSSPSLTMRPYYTNYFDNGTIHYFDSTAFSVFQTASWEWHYDFVDAIIPANSLIIFETSAISAEDDIDWVHMTFNFTIN